jgi:hypothetical protein
MKGLVQLGRALIKAPKQTKRQLSVKKKMDALDKKYSLGKYEDPTMKAIEKGSAYGLGAVIGAAGFRDLKRKMQNSERKEIK